MKSNNTRQEIAEGVNPMSLPPMTTPHILLLLGAGMLVLSAPFTAASQEPVGEASAVGPVGSPALSPAAGGHQWKRFHSESGTNNLVRIEGTGSLHNWEVEGRTIDGDIEVTPGFPSHATKDQPGTMPARAELFIPIRSLKSVESGKPFSSKMDDIMYERLREGTNGRIHYSLTEIALKEVAKGDAPWMFETRGNLSIAGVSRVIVMPVEMKPGQDQLRFRAQLALKMSEFGIEPVTVGTAQRELALANDEVNLTVEWTAVAVKPD